MGKRLVCRVVEIPENGLKECELEGGLKLVVANSGGEFFGFQAICPHQEVPLCEGLFDGSVLTCHGERTAPGGFMLKKGEVFGWAALLDGYPARIASARCLEESALLRINGKAALRVLEGDPAAGLTVMRRLAALIARYLASSGAK